MFAKKDLIGKITIPEDVGNYTESLYASIGVLVYRNRGYDFIIEQNGDTVGLTYKQALGLRRALDEMLEWD